MKTTTLTIPVLNGDGISDEIMAATKHVIETVMHAGNTKIEWIDLHMGEHALEKFGTALDPNITTIVAKHGVAIKGPSTTPDGTGYRSVNVELRKSLNLFACIRPVKYFNDSVSPIKKSGNVDMVIFRENLEDLYAGVEFEAESNMANEILGLAMGHEYDKFYRPAVGLKLISVPNTVQLMMQAVKYARAYGRKKITVVAKANIMKYTDGLFVEVCEDVFKADVFNTNDHGLTFESKHIDAVAEEMPARPELYDVIVTENVYGDILSSLAGGLIGGVRFCPGVNMNESIAVFEATHGTAPTIAGKNLANPIALILSAEMMLRHLKYENEANAIAKAIRDYFGEFENEKDFPSRTRQVGQYIAEASKNYLVEVM